jgi:hypothetical protein
MNAKKNKGPVFVASKGNVKIPVYTIKPGCRNEHHTVCYYEGGQRQRRYFSNMEKAKAEAVIIAEKISKGDLEAIRLTGIDRQRYMAALEELCHTGATLESAAREYASALTQLKGTPLHEAVQFYVEHRSGQFTPMKVPQVVAELLEQKVNKGRSEVYSVWHETYK